MCIRDSSEHRTFLHLRGGGLCEVLPSFARTPWPGSHSPVPGVSVSRAQALCRDHRRPHCSAAISFRQDAAPAVSSGSHSISCFWQLALAHFGGLIWPTLGTLS